MQLLRVSYPDENYDVICAYSEARYKKDKREMQKQIEKAKALIARKEAGRRAKFVKKENATYLFDEALQQKTELLLGIKGYCTNIPKTSCQMSKLFCTIIVYGTWNRHFECQKAIYVRDQSFITLTMRFEHTF